jgi:hypothetical protein
MKTLSTSQRGAKGKQQNTGKAQRQQQQQRGANQRLSRQERSWPEVLDCRFSNSWSGNVN